MSCIIFTAAEDPGPAEVLHIREERLRCFYFQICESQVQFVEISFQIKCLFSSFLVLLLTTGFSSVALC